MSQLRLFAALDDRWCSQTKKSVMRMLGAAVAWLLLSVSGYADSIYSTI